MMKSSKTITIAVVLVLALVVSALLYNYLSSTKTTVYVFNGDYPTGTKVTESMLSPLQIDSQIIAQTNVTGSTGATYVTAKDKSTVLKDAYLRQDVFKGMAFLKNQTEKFGGTPGVVRLAPGDVAITIDADNATAGSPAIQPGARVDVFVGYDAGGDSLASKIEVLLFQNIQVVDVFYGQNASNSKILPIAGVTLEVPAQDATKLAFAAQFGKIHLGQVKAGYTEIQPVPYSMTDILAPAAGALGQPNTKTAIPPTKK